MAEIKSYTYTGRTDDGNVAERIHQVMEEFGDNQADFTHGESPFVFIGFASDEGVARNKGRTGQREAPFSVRSFLGSMPYTKPLYDYGTVMGTGDLETSQNDLGDAVLKIYASRGFPLIIGGGHETLYGHYLGVRERHPEAKLAVINFDAHFDLRDERPSSGTMFHQILSDDDNIDYYVYGIQQSGNTQALFDTAEDFGVKYHTIDDVRSSLNFREELEYIAANYDCVFATLCMDSVAQPVAPGTSAPAQNGYTAYEIHTLVGEVATLDNLISFDISEVCPALDIDGRTSRLAASLFHKFMMDRETSE